MSNVTPIRFIDAVAKFRQDTVNELFEGTLPAVGDTVRTVIFVDDDGSGTWVTIPGFGVIRDVETHRGMEHPSITLRFDFGMSVTLTGSAELVWNPGSES